MNWDISIGRVRQVAGRALQLIGQRVSSRRFVLDGEAMEYAGRLQTRYGTLKHQAQWGHDMQGGSMQAIATRHERPLTAARKNFSV